MTIRHICNSLLASAGALALAACGGGGSSGTNFIPAAPATPTSIPTPPPTPTPTPTPTPSGVSAINIFPAINSDTQFAVVGLEAPNRPGNATLTSTGFSVRYDASAGLYVMDVPATQPGGLYQYDANSPNASWWSGPLQDSSGGWLAGVQILKPSNPQLQLTYTTLVGYNSSGMSPEPLGWVAFGTATPQGAVPVTGSATYALIGRGSEIDDRTGWIDGAGSLVFGFGSGQLSGYFDPSIHPYAGIGEGYALGRYTVVNSIYSTGNTTFSGQLSNPGLTQNGSFSGLFTGPNAQELMSTWSAPFHNPITNQDSQMFGVWLGKH